MTTLFGCSEPLFHFILLFSSLWTSINMLLSFVFKIHVNTKLWVKDYDHHVRCGMLHFKYFETGLSLISRCATPFSLFIWSKPSQIRWVISILWESGKNSSISSDFFVCVEAYFRKSQSDTSYAGITKIVFRDCCQKYWLNTVLWILTNYHDEHSFAEDFNKI